ncbi:MAG: cobaltochelatase subunit CobN, partial [Gemmataceae bacterium]
QLGNAPQPAKTGEGFFFLTHADTDLLALQAATRDLPADFPPVRAISLNRIASDEHMTAVLSAYLPASRVVVVRVLGGLRNTPGLKQLADLARAQGRHLLLTSGTGQPDPELLAASTVPPQVLHDGSAYLHAGGVANFAALLRFLSDRLALTGYGYEAPVPLPEHGIYRPGNAMTTLDDWLKDFDPAKPTIGVLFYRSHWLSGNTGFIDALSAAIEARGAQALAVFTSSLKARGAGSGPAAFELLQHQGKVLVDALIATLSFAMGEVNAGSTTTAGWSVTELESLGVPVLQALCGSTARWQWAASPRGLHPLDTAMNVALPEFDGRLITVPISFKENLATPQLPAAQYVALPERVARVVELALRFAALRRKPNAEKKIAFVLTNAPGKAARIGNAVGLDAPASLLHVLQAMQAAGYHVEGVPASGDALIHELIERCSYDETLLTSGQLASAMGLVDEKVYDRWFAELPATQQQRMNEQWGAPPGSAYVHEGKLALAGLELGNVLVALQPPRGYGMDPNAIYHQPDLPPPHNYFALYRWLRDEWRADAIVHLGKHGTLEWLPGKSIGLSQDCFPDAFLAELPLFYPFILNDPGEGAQAKRRAHAVIVDHLTPPMMSADAHGVLAQLMQLVDEYYQVEMLDPGKLPLVQQQIWNLIQQAHLEEDLKFLMQQGHEGHTHEWDEGTADDGTPLSIAQLRGMEVAHLVQELDGYLCELAGAQIRDGLHILGQVPQGDQQIGLLQALTRLPNLDVPGLRESMAALLGFELANLLQAKGAPLANEARRAAIAALADKPIATSADVLELIDELSRHLLETFAARGFRSEEIDAVIAAALPPVVDVAAASLTALREVLEFVAKRLVPELQRTGDEITNLLAGLAGKYVPAGPSGAPTRGMAHVLPTGRNFYAVDPRALPSFAAWQVGQQLAREVLDRHRRETGSWPESIGISIWGTSAMRTHGDDVAQVLALLGVRPVWHRENRRVSGVELIPLAELRRPRIV